MPVYNPAGSSGALTPFSFDVDLTTLPGGGATLQLAAVGPANGIIKIESLVAYCSQSAASGFAATLSIGMDSALSGNANLCTASPVATVAAGRFCEGDPSGLNKIISWNFGARPIVDIAGSVGLDDTAVGTTQKAGGFLLAQSRGQGLFIRNDAAGAPYTAGRVQIYGLWRAVTSGATFQ